MAGETRNSWVNAVTAVSTTVAAALLLGTIGTIKDLAIQAPLITSHMAATSNELMVIKDKQVEQSVLLATLAKDYTSRDNLRAELEKLEAKIRDLHVQQALLRQRLDSIPTKR